MTPPLLLLAGTSESGKSTAGAYLASLNVQRVKIRTILGRLTSGIPAEHEGVPVRVAFDHAEFVDLVLRLPVPVGRIAVAIESFIDAALAEATRDTWPGPACIVFITADRTNRLRRLATLKRLTHDDAAALLDGKDARKRVDAQLDRWRAIADDWIDNNDDLDAYLARLDRILTNLTRQPQGPS